MPSAALAPNMRLEGAVGVYRFADGAVAALFDEAGGLRLVDYQSGALRQLTRQAPNVFVGGPGVSVPTPVSVRVVLGPSRAGSTASIWVDREQATRIPLATRSVRFGGSGGMLAGRLIVPPGKGPFPAVVIVPATRDTNELWALFYASRGFAVLSYDKPGAGGSSGKYVLSTTDANLRNLASNAVAAVAWLRRQPQVNSARIGLSGGSQAGWVITIAAAQSPLVRFAAIQSGPAMSVGRQQAYAALTKYGVDNPTDAQVEAALNIVPDSGFDPRPALASIGIPVLWQLGALDKRMYTPETVANLTALTARAGHAFTQLVYPGAAHSLRLTSRGLTVEERTSPGFAPGVFMNLAAWLRSNT